MWTSKIELLKWQKCSSLRYYFKSNNINNKPCGNVDNLSKVT